MAEPAVVTAADGSDTPAIARVIREVYEPFTTGFAPTSLRWTESTVDSRDWLMARSGGELIGVVRHYLDTEGYSFDSLAVLPRARTRGVGTALVQAVERIAADSPAHQMIIAVRDSMPANIRFFAGLGYVQDRPFTSAHHVYLKRIGALK
jgi:GNAT superfamily N-acetyltransferase